MNEPVVVTRSALVRLLDAVLYPNPDDPGDPSPPWWGPYGPIGPVIGRVLSDLSWVLLNPQPLPPRAIGPVTRGALLDALLYPNPDDPDDPGLPWWGPYGPIGPVIGGVLRGLSWVLLNPQPLPPRDRGALQKILGRSSTSARREEVGYVNAGRLGFGVLLILVMISLSVWLLRRRSREEVAPAVPMEAEEEGVLLEEEGVVVPPGPPSAEDVVTPIEDPPPLGEERPPGAY